MRNAVQTFHRFDDFDLVQSDLFVRREFGSIFNLGAERRVVGGITTVAEPDRGATRKQRQDAEHERDC